jgi:hypothetical protein
MLEQVLSGCKDEVGCFVDEGRGAWDEEPCRRSGRPGDPLMTCPSALLDSRRLKVWP